MHYALILFICDKSIFSQYKLKLISGNTLKIGNYNRHRDKPVDSWLLFSEITVLQDLKAIRWMIKLEQVILKSLLEHIVLHDAMTCILSCMMLTFMTFQ